MKFLVLNGPNLNLLGVREPGVYGSQTYEDLLAFLMNSAKNLSVDVECRQTNHEGVLVDWIQEARQSYDGIIINPAAYTHTSIAILDALLAVKLPAVEVHLSDTQKREAFRKQSYAGLACQKTFQGFGFEGYRLAMEWLKHHLEQKNQTGNAIEIRPYKDTDWEHLQRIHDAARQQELARCGYLEGYTNLLATFEEENLFEGQVAVLLLHEVPRGFVAFTNHEITWFYVEPGYQRRGFGKKLLYYTLQHTKRPLSVWVLHGNLPATSFYESLGFNFMEEKRGPLHRSQSQPIYAIGLRYGLMG